MRQTPRFVAAGTLAVVFCGGMTLAAAPAALADDCTGLLHCAGKDVGDTVRSATKGDVHGTVKHVGKTARDGARETGKTARDATGNGPEQQSDEPDPTPSADQAEDAQGHASASAPAQDQASHKQPGHRSHAKRAARSKHRTGAREQADSHSASLALRQWREHSLPRGPGWPYAIDEARAGPHPLSEGAGFPSTAAMPRGERAPDPRVAPDEQTAAAHGAAPYLAADRRAATAPLGGADEPSDALVLLAAVLAAATGAGYLAAHRRRNTHATRARG